MDNEIIHIEQPQRNVSFINTSKRPAFSNGQLKLLQLCNDKLKSGEAITFQELRMLWLRYVMTERWIVSWRSYSTIKYTRDDIIKTFDRDDDYYLSTTVLNWCKINIGSLVLKGALIAIPVLKLDDKALEYLDKK